MSREFRLGLGHPALELVATLAGRRREPLERLDSPETLADWLGQAGLVAGATCTEEHLAGARELREAVYRLVEAARTEKRPRPADVRVLNVWAAVAPPVPELDARLQTTWRAPDLTAAALGTLARSAVALLTGPDLARVRNCADPTCSLLFIDRSRPGRRRWCSMDRCGNKTKTARYRTRVRASASRTERSGERRSGAVERTRD
jgi:predicted RNA-binding Zn ribbon-like protein